MKRSIPFLLAAIALGCLAQVDRADINVSGRWSFYFVCNGARCETETLALRDDGGLISGEGSRGGHPITVAGKQNGSSITLEFTEYIPNLPPTTFTVTGKVRRGTIRCRGEGFTFKAWR